MCGENYWKGISVFCLTFGLSVFVSNVFSVRQAVSQTCPIKITISTQPPMVERPFVDNKNCAPLDNNLKYQKLDAKGLSEPETEKKAKEKEAQKENKKAGKSTEVKLQPYNPKKETAEYKVLLHKEKCYEEQK